MYISTPEIKTLISRAFPDFAGKHIQLQPFCGPMSLQSYWSGGSRDYWTVLPLDDSKPGVGHIPENGTPFTDSLKDLTALPEGFALIQHHRGSYTYATVYVNASNLTKMLPAPIELTKDEKTVLEYTKKLKSSYAGIKNYRFHEACRDVGITLDRWEAAKALCISRGMLNKAGAITESGRNAVSQ